MKISDFFQGIGSAIGFYPDLVPIAGSHHAAIFLCQLCYWTGKQHNPEGWIYKTQEDWQLETELSPKEQKTARTLLVSKGFIQERFVGIPRRLEYRVLVDAINTLWESWVPAMRIKFWLRNKLKEEATLLSRGLADESLEKVITVLREGLTQARKTPKNAESIEKSIIDQMEIIEKTTLYPYSTDRRIKEEPNGDTRSHQAEILGKTLGASLLYTKITQENTSENTQIPPLPQEKKEVFDPEGNAEQTTKTEISRPVADISHTESAGINVSGDPLRDAAVRDNKTKQDRWQNVNELIESVMNSILSGDPIPRTVLEEARSRRWTFPWRSRDRHNMYGTCNPALVEFICKERASWKVGCKWESKISGVVATIQAKEQTCAGWEELLIYLERMKQQTSSESHAILAPILPANTVSVPPETNEKPTEDQLRHQELFAKERAALQAKLKEQALAKEQARAKQGSGKTSAELEAEFKALRQAELQAALGQGGI